MSTWIEYLIGRGYIEPPINVALQLPEATLPLDLARWPTTWREMYEERAAIIEYDGGLPRSVAEEKAERIVFTMYKLEAASKH